MKKIILPMFMGSLLCSLVNADHTVVTPHEEPAVIVEHAPEVCECPFGGIYFGLGIGGSFYKNEHDKIKTQNVNRFIGTLALGAGKVFKDVFYLGLEGMMDFTKSSNKDSYYSDDSKPTDDEIKNSGFLPSIGIRFGYTKNTWLFYGKISASHASCEAKDKIDGGTEKYNKFAPALAIGIEKSFCKKFTARLEGEYRFASKEKGFSSNKGFAVRALVNYNIKI